MLLRSDDSALLLLPFRDVDDAIDDVLCADVAALRQRYMLLRRF